MISFDGVEVTAMDCLGYGKSAQSYPTVGQIFEPRFTCLFDDDDPVDWNSLFGVNRHQFPRHFRAVQYAVFQTRPAIVFH